MQKVVMMGETQGKGLGDDNHDMGDMMTCHMDLWIWRCHIHACGMYT